MRAVTYSRPGGPEVLDVHVDYPKPTRGKGQVLIKVHGK